MSDETTQVEPLWRIGTAAYEQQQPEVAVSAMQVLADLGQTPAMVNVGVLLGQLGRSEDEIAVYDELLARFTGAPEPALRERVAKALFNKGVRLGALGRSQDEIAGEAISPTAQPTDGLRDSGRTPTRAAGSYREALRADIT
jgi:hypothetical protein